MDRALHPRACNLHLIALVSRSEFYNREVEMKPEIHPEYKQIQVTCSCGNSFETGSTAGKDLSIEVCSACHPFYTGKQKVMDTAGQVDKFRRRYGAK